MKEENQTRIYAEKQRAIQTNEKRVLLFMK